MNHYVPDFEMDDDDSTIPTSSGFSRPNTKPSLPEDDLMELLWKNGQVVLQSQTQKTSKRSHQPTPPPLTARSNPSQSSTSAALTTEEPPYQLFMQEDEMASWLHYPLEDESFQRDFCSDLLYPAPSSRVNQIPVATPPLPPPPPPAPIPPGKQRDELESGSSKFHHFMRFSRPNVRAESQPSVSDKAVRESTVVESNETPTVRLNQDSMNHDRGAADQDREVGTCDLTMTSSSGGSGGSADPLAKPPLNDRKRKGREHDDDDDDDEDTKYEAADTKKQVRGSASARRSRAAEVHNLSERRRRDRINEKMKALQELIPRCNKSDKASMLDEAIEYLKSLQLQVQMMSMGCSMVPMMFPGVQPYMSPMGMSMGMGMGVGMGMDMGMSRPMMPFPQVLAGSSMPRPAAAAHLIPRLPMQAYHLPPGSSPDVSVMRPNQPDPSLNPIGFRSPNPMQVPFAESYHRYLSHYNMQAPPPPPPPQVHTMARASTSKGVDSLKNQKLGCRRECPAKVLLRRGPLEYAVIF